MNKLCRGLGILLLVGAVCVFAKSPDNSSQKARGLMVNAFHLVEKADEILTEAKIEQQKGERENKKVNPELWKEAATKAEPLYYEALKGYLLIDSSDADCFRHIITFRIAYCNSMISILRKQRGIESKMEPVDEIMEKLQGNMSLEKMEELLKARNTELIEVKKELEETTRKLEQEIQKNTLPNP